MVSSSLISFCIRKTVLGGVLGRRKLPLKASSMGGRDVDRGFFLRSQCRWLLFGQKKPSWRPWDAENGRLKPPPWEDSTSTDGFFRSHRLMLPHKSDYSSKQYACLRSQYFGRIFIMVVSERHSRLLSTPDYFCPRTPTMQKQTICFPSHFMIWFHVCMILRGHPCFGGRCCHYGA